MPELTSTTAKAPAAAVVQKIRSAVVGDRITVAEAAAAFEVTERTIYNAIAQHKIPFVTLMRTRYVKPEDMCKAFFEQHTPPRGRGRPKKAA